LNNYTKISLSGRPIQIPRAVE